MRSNNKYKDGSFTGNLGIFPDETAILQEVLDYKQRAFYISGPPSMVSSFKGVLIKMGVAENKIKTDYFPGFA